MASSRPNMSENKVKFEDSSKGFYVENISSKEALQLEALRRGEPELCLLLSSKKPEKAAQEYVKLKDIYLDEALERKITYEKHQLELEAARRQEMNRPVPACVVMQPKQE